MNLCMCEYVCVRVHVFVRVYEWVYLGACVDPCMFESLRVYLLSHSDGGGPRASEGHGRA